MESLRRFESSQEAWGKAVTSRKCPTEHQHHYAGAESPLNSLLQPGDELLCLNGCILMGIERNRVLLLFTQLERDTEFTVVVRRSKLRPGRKSLWKIHTIKAQATIPQGADDCVDGPCYSITKLEETVGILNIDLRCDNHLKVHIRLQLNRGCLHHGENRRLTIDNCNGCNNTFECIRYHSAEQWDFALLIFTDKGQQNSVSVKNNCLTFAHREYKGKCPSDPEHSDLFKYHTLNDNMIAFESFTSEGFYIVHDSDKGKVELGRLSNPEEYDCAKFILETIKDEDVQLSERVDISRISAIIWGAIA